MLEYYLALMLGALLGAFHLEQCTYVRTDLQRVTYFEFQTYVSNAHRGAAK